MPARPKPKAAILLKNEAAILIRTTWMMKLLHEPAIVWDNFWGGHTQNPGAPCERPLSSLFDQNGEAFVTCCFDLGTFSFLFRPPSDWITLGTIFSGRLCFIAYNCGTATIKKPILSLLLRWYKNHVVTRFRDILEFRLNVYPFCLFVILYCKI